MSTSIIIAIILVSALGILVTVIACPRNTAQICCCMVILAVVGVTAFGQNCNCFGFSQGNSSFSGLIARIVPGVETGVGHNYFRSINPCPPETNLGQYGPAARYDGILIQGSPEFVSRTVTALRRLDGTESYRYALALKSITEREINPRALAQVAMAHAEVAPKTSRMSCTLYAGVIAHEGAHVIHGRGHGPVYAAEAKALREMGEPYAAEAVMRMAGQ